MTEQELCVVGEFVRGTPMEFNALDILLKYDDAYLRGRTKPPNAFFLYRVECLKKIPRLKINQQDISKMIASKWETEDSKVKNGFRMIAERLRNRYRLIRCIEGMGLFDFDLANREAMISSCDRNGDSEFDSRSTDVSGSVSAGTEVEGTKMNCDDGTNGTEFNVWMVPVCDQYGNILYYMNYV